MEKYLSDLNKFVHDIKSSDLYKEIINLEEEIASNKELTTLINKVKAAQKANVNSKENNLSELEKELNSYKLYQIYLRKLKELNNELISYELIINDYFDELTN